MSTLLIRDGVFETNSSSSHSLVLNNNLGVLDEEMVKESIDNLAWDGELVYLNKENKNKCSYEERYKHEDYLIRIYSADLYFGESQRIVSTWYDRLCYLIASVNTEEDNPIDKIYEIIDIVGKKLNDPHFKGFKIHLYEPDIKDAITRYSINESMTIFGITQSIRFKDVDIGYSDSNLYNLVTSKKKCIDYEDFIFNNKFIVITGSSNDELIYKLEKIFTKVNGYDIIN